MPTKTLSIQQVNPVAASISKYPSLRKMVAHGSDSRGSKMLAKPQRKSLPHVTPQPPSHLTAPSSTPSSTTRSSETTAITATATATTTPTAPTSSLLPLTAASHFTNPLQRFFASNTPLSNAKLTLGSNGGHALSLLELEHLASTRLTIDRIVPLRPLQPPRSVYDRGSLQPLKPTRPAPNPKPELATAHQPRPTVTVEPSNPSKRRKESSLTVSSSRPFSTSTESPSQPLPLSSDKGDKMTNLFGASSIDSSFNFSSTSTSSQRSNASPKSISSQLPASSLPKFKNQQEKQDYFREKIQKMESEEREIRNQLFQNQKEKEVLEGVYKKLAEEEKRRKSR